MTAFATLYAYGHLVTIAFSLTLALACTVVAFRIPGARRDLWQALAYLLIAGIGAVEMALALRPSLALARAYILVGGGAYASLVVGFHEQYADDVLPPSRRRLYRLGVRAYVAFGTVLFVLIVAGMFDGGNVRHVWVGGAQSMLPAMPPWACALAALFAFGNLPLCAELYHREGPKQTERWLIAVGMWGGPIVAAWDLAIAAGINPYLPVGGYFSALLGLEGSIILVEHLRTSARGASSIGGYRIEKRLGRGGMAEVFLASRRGSDELAGVVQRVALKRLHSHHADEPHFVRDFLDEARLLARLSHPNIVRLLDAGREGGALYLAMELVEGATLFEIIRIARSRQERVSTAVVAEVGVQLCDALAYAHALGRDDGSPLEIIHRDVSPQNVLLDRDGHVKLSDFGIARWADRTRQTSTGLMRGKLAYMAPEQLRGGHYDHRVDLYATGVVLFELASGFQPHESAGDAALIYEILEGKPGRLDWLQEAPGQLADTIRQALAALPAARFKDAAALRARLLPLRDEPRARGELAAWVRLAIEARALPHVVDVSQAETL